MAENELSREEDLRQLLTDAIEVQLAALKAGISFWSEWIEQTSEFVQSATTSLSSIKAEKDQAKDVLLELVDAGRASVRSMTEIPRHTALRFIEELDKLEEKKAEEAASPGAPAPAPARARAAAPAPARPTAGSSAAAAGPAVAKRSAAKGKGRPRPKRAGRVKS